MATDKGIAAGRILTVDIGNTATKAAVFESERPLRSVVIFDGDPEPVKALMAEFTPQQICYCRVGEDRHNMLAMLESTGLPMVVLGPDTPLPIGVDYDRSTLGADRIAAAVGVAEPGSAAMVIDAGTAVTIDLVADDRFLGGNISPGLKLRFRSLNKFTSRLPLVNPEGALPHFGNDTTTAIRAGVVRGLAAEIAAAFDEGRRMYPGIRMVLTGGDASLLRPFLTQYGLDPEEDPDAVGRGLARICAFGANGQLTMLNAKC